SRSISLDTALAASTLSDLLSTTMISTGLPKTSGLISQASSMPSTVISPPAALGPVMGSKTPILMGCAKAKPTQDEQAKISTSRAKPILFTNTPPLVLVKTMILQVLWSVVRKLVQNIH